MAVTQLNRSYILGPSITSEASIKVSIDNGSTWTSVGNITDSMVSDIASDPYNPLYATVAGTDGIYYTRDGGVSWSTAGGGYTTGFFKRIHYVDSLNIFIIGDDFLISSVDGGLTYEDVVSTTSLNPAGIGRCLYFTSIYTGCIGIDEKLYTTIDGGNSWIAANSDTEIVPGENIYSITINSDNLTINVATTNELLVSVDFGLNFTSSQTTGAFVGYEQQLFRVNDIVLYALTGGDGSIYKTIDSGSTWTFESAISGSYLSPGFIDLYMSSDSTGVFIPEDGPVYRTDNSGSSTTNVTSEERFISVAGANYFCGDCPSGFILDSEGICKKTYITDAVYSDDTIIITAGSVNALYGSKGLNLMPDISLMPLQILGQGSSNVTYLFRQNNGTGSIVNSISGYGPTTFDLNSPILSPLWKTRLNTVGIWAPGFPECNPNTSIEKCAPVSFSFCVNVDTTKTYLIGIAGDNEVGFSIDGTDYVRISALNNATYVPFTYWHVFPVTLSAGQHTIVLNGYNYPTVPPGPPTPASLGAEIYDIDLATFQSTLCLPTNVAADIEPYIIFSTKDQIGLEIPDPNDPDYPGTYSCPDGSDVNYCNGVPTCIIDEYAYLPSCCYKLTDCEGNISDVFTQTNLSAYLDSIITVEEYPGVCFTPEVLSDPCLDAAPVTVTDSFVACDACIPSYKFYNCEDYNVFLYTIQDLAAYVSPSKVVTLEEFPGTCWIVGVNNDYPYTPSTYTITGEVNVNCESCKTNYYQLTNCNNNDIFIITSDNLKNYLGKAVEIDGYPGLCFNVTAPACDCIYAIIDIGEGTIDATLNSYGVVNGKPAYSLVITDDYVIAWSSADQRWELYNATLNRVDSYTYLNNDCPFSGAWVFVNMRVLSITPCVTSLYSVEVINSFEDCECCLDKNCR